LLCSPYYLTAFFVQHLFPTIIDIAKYFADLEKYTGLDLGNTIKETFEKINRLIRGTRKTLKNQKEN
jgi:hypothetical protein